MVICAHCGKEFNEENEVATVDAAHFCCEECAREEGYGQCDNCCEFYPRGGIDEVVVCGYRFCGSDCAVDQGFEICSNCGDWVDSDHMFFIEDIHISICDSCFCNGAYYTCDDCGDYYSENGVWERDGNMCICNHCSDSYTTCCDCGAIVHMDDVYYDPFDNARCEECYNERNTSINEYSYKPYPEFFESEDENDQDNPLYIGVELEVDDGSDCDECAEEIVDNNVEIYCKRDGSLNRGIEIVSHPCTLSYHENNLDWPGIMSTCLKYGFKSHDTSTCGIHTHVNRSFFGYTCEERDLNIAKVILLVNRFWDSHIVPFTRRDIYNLNRWGAKNCISINKTDSNREIVRKTKCSSNGGRGRYVAVNLRNNDTIEFRIFRGTLKYDTFIAILQFVDTICRFVKKISINDIDNIFWEDIFENTTHKELLEYLESKTDFDPEKVSTVFQEPQPTFDFECLAELPF